MHNGNNTLLRRRVKAIQSATFYKVFFSFSALLIYSSTLHADETDSSIHYEITPYLWAATFSGTVAADGNESPPINSDYHFFSLNNLDGVFSIALNANAGRWRFLADYMYVAYKDTFFEKSSLETTLRLDGDISELAVAYKLSSIDDLELITGARYQNIDINLSISNTTAQASAGWLDPFIGLIYTATVSNRFYISMRGDIGGLNSDNAVNAQAMLNYQFNKSLSAKLGYRYLKVYFKETNFVYDLGLDGFQFGLGIKFN